MMNATVFSNLFDLYNNTDKSELSDLITMLKHNPYVLPNPETGYLLLCHDVLRPDPKSLIETCIENFDLVKNNVDLALTTLCDSDSELLRATYGLDDGVRTAYISLEPKISESLTHAWATAIRCLRHPKRRRYFTEIVA